MHFRRTYRGNDAFPDAGDYSRFPGAANQPFNVGAHGNPRFNPQFNTVFRHRTNDRRFNDFRVNAHLYRFQHVAAGQINGAGPFKGKVNGCPMRCNQGVDDPVHVTPCQVMGFQLIGIYIKACLVCLDQRKYDFIRRHPAQPHPHQIENADADACGYGRNPKSHRHKLQKDEHADYNQKKAGAAAHE